MVTPAGASTAKMLKRPELLKFLVLQIWIISRKPIIPSKRDGILQKLHPSQAFYLLAHFINFLFFSSKYDYFFIVDLLIRYQISSSAVYRYKKLWKHTSFAIRRSCVMWCNQRSYDTQTKSHEVVVAVATTTR